MAVAAAAAVLPAGVADADRGRAPVVVAVRGADGLTAGVEQAF